MLSAKHCTVIFGLLYVLLTISVGAAPDHRATAGEPVPLPEKVLEHGGRDLVTVVGSTTSVTPGEHVALYKDPTLEIFDNAAYETLNP